MQSFDLSTIPRLPLCLLPTPLEPMDRLSKHLSSSGKIYVKRDDLTGVALGGNKNRKLEFLLADALEKGVDFIITEGAVTSNHCLQTAACSAKIGLDCALVLSDAFVGDSITGNLLLDQILDAQIVRVSNSSDRKAAMEQLAEQKRGEGRIPYIIPTGGSNIIGLLGYVAFVQEIVQQAEELGLTFDYLVHGAGSAGTQAGLLIGKALFYPQLKVIGIAAGGTKAALIDKTKQLVQEFQKQWSVSLALTDADYIVYDDYVGEGYGIPTKELVETVKLTAKMEGIFLDPVYNGKAMVGLVDLLSKKTISRKASVLFLHSGGAPALFAYSDVFGKKLA